jgi:hypothetical protein
VDIPPDDECTLTVGLEAIGGDLEGLLNLRGDAHNNFVRADFRLLPKPTVQPVVA